MQDKLSRHVILLSNDEAWQRLPVTPVGPGRVLPVWARALASELPFTTAAMVRLDYMHRARGQLDPKLRGKMRWIAARSNGCAYSETYAAADLRRAGLNDEQMQHLSGDPFEAPVEERQALDFARKMTLAIGTITDEEVAELIQSYAEEEVVAMVLLLAQASFQDLIILALGLPLEPAGPLEPLEVRFSRRPVDAEGFMRQRMPGMHPSAGDAGRRFAGPQGTQRDHPEQDNAAEPVPTRKPRIRVPSLEQVRERFGSGESADRPLQAHLHRVCLGYQPELANAWFACTRAFRQESNLDPAFNLGLWWIAANTLHCSYCVGHCEMVAPHLDRQALAGTDPTAASPREQVAYALARKASERPSSVTPEDLDELVHHFGSKGALEIIWCLGLSHYFTRLSEVFQLPMERENVFGGTLGAQGAAT